MKVRIRKDWSLKKVQEVLDTVYLIATIDVFDIEFEIIRADSLGQGQDFSNCFLVECKKTNSIYVAGTKCRDQDRENDRSYLPTILTEEIE